MSKIIDKDTVAFEEYKKAFYAGNLGYGNKGDFITGFDAGWKSKPRLPIFTFEKDIDIDESTLELNAGYVDKDGVICNYQAGIGNTFSIGMPMYDENGTMLGRLCIGLFYNLSYDDGTPCHYWHIKDYQGEQIKVLTYHQFIRKKIQSWTQQK